MDKIAALSKRTFLCIVQRYHFENRVAEFFRFDFADSVDRVKFGTRRGLFVREFRQSFVAENVVRRNVVFFGGFFAP